VAPSGAIRLLPVVGFSLSELDDAGINPQVAERLGLPVDGARIGAYSANVSALRVFVHLARQPNWGQRTGDRLRRGLGRDILSQ
jgi:hypothetical protein